MSETNCKNCAAPLSSEHAFCPQCGQNTYVHRLDMGHILHELIHVVTHADKGIFHLTKEMALRPGLVAKAYVAGSRKKYFNPFSYFVLTVAVSAFLTAKFHLLQSDTTHANPVSALIGKNINLVFFVAAPVSALFTWALFWRSRYNYAENLTLHAFLGGFRVMFFMLIFTPLIVFFRPYYFSMLTVYLVLWAAFTTWANYQFFGGRLWLVALKTLLSLMLTQVVITFGIILFVRFFM
ncbi:MAG: DUF3667 domain-containing protein [Saprospiraceae bacterium]|nr:DUF3667 domain-containing protein [Saprospiraceae bacterium]